MVQLEINCLNSTENYYKIHMFFFQCSAVVSSRFQMCSSIPTIPRQLHWQWTKTKTKTKANNQRQSTDGRTWLLFTCCVSWFGLNGRLVGVVKCVLNGPLMGLKRSPLLFPHCLSLGTESPPFSIIHLPAFLLSVGVGRHAPFIGRPFTHNPFQLSDLPMLDFLSGQSMSIFIHGVVYKLKMSKNQFN